MRLLLISFLLFFSTFYLSCKSDRNPGQIQGTWQCLWQKDISLQLRLNDDGRFKVTLTRTGQVHNNLGWYSTKDNLFMIRDSVDYPLPVCNIADTGKYTFRLQQDTLQFTVVEDKCERRSAALQLDRFVRID